MFIEEKRELQALIAAATVGSLTFAFSDSFWFSAVEGEVYAMSALFTALVFFSGLKYYHDSSPFASRWLILIFFLTGLSIGVHMLNLLAIPAVVMLAYYKNYKTTIAGSLLALILGVAILGFIQGLLIPGTIKAAAVIEMYFVNELNLSFNSGVIFFVTATFLILLLIIILSGRGKNLIIHYSTLSILVFLIGYSSFFLVPIRSAANPPMDENNPDDAIGLLSYLNRDQYGDWPLIQGPYFNTPLDEHVPYSDGTPLYRRNEKLKKYVLISSRKESVPNYDKRFTTYFPRMHSRSSDHIKAYHSWGRITGDTISFKTAKGTEKTIVQPRFSENLLFFFSYQLNFMYFRYFLWNFAGKNNDIQGYSDNYNGNFRTGVPPLDRLKFGNSRVPEPFRINKGLNNYFLLPLVLGLLGMIFHFQNNSKGALVTLLLFFFTGIAIILYLNQTPYQPRERDYAFTGSFFAFSIWIGFGVLYVFHLFKKWLNEKPSFYLTTIICLTLVPINMLAQNYDDHDRSGRSVARDYAKNILSSCDRNAVLFAYGDNDTFPLWYLQDVEGYRTDVRVINFGLVGFDWNIEQARRKYFDSEPLPLGMPQEKYFEGRREWAYFTGTGYRPIKEIMDSLASEDKRKKIIEGEAIYDLAPSADLIIPVDKQNALRSMKIPHSLVDSLTDEVKFSINKSGIMKADIFLLDLLANFNWSRPIHFSFGGGRNAYNGLEPYFYQQGLTYKLLPLKPAPIEYDSSGKEIPAKIPILLDYTSDLLLNSFSSGGLENTGVYADETTLYLYDGVESAYYDVAKKLIEEKRIKEATKVLQKYLKLFPASTVPPDITTRDILPLLYECKLTTQADELSELIFRRSKDEYLFYHEMDEPHYTRNESKRFYAYYVCDAILNIVEEARREELSAKFRKALKQ